MSISLTLVARGASNVVFRNMVLTKTQWPIIVAGFFEPVLYLFSIGIGVGQLIDGFEFHGRHVEHAALVAPAMLASSAMNGAIYESTVNIFFKLKFEKVCTTRCWLPRCGRPTSPGGRDRLGADARLALLRGVPGHHDLDGPGRLVVGLCSRSPPAS